MLGGVECLVPWAFAETTSTTGRPVGLGGELRESANMTAAVLTCLRRVAPHIAWLPEYTVHCDSGWCSACWVVWSGRLVEVGE